MKLNLWPNWITKISFCAQKREINLIFKLCGSVTSYHKFCGNKFSVLISVLTYMALNKQSRMFHVCTSDLLLHQTNTSGEFAARQCSASTGFCYCATETGEVIEGTSYSKDKDYVCRNG